MKDQGAVALMTAGALGPLVVFYWASVTFFFFLNDKGDIINRMRHTKKADLTRKENPIENESVLRYAPIVFTLMNFLTLSAVLCKPDIPVATFFHTFSDVMLLNLASDLVFDNISLVFKVFWVVVAMVCILFIITLLRLYLRRSSDSLHRTRHLISLNWVMFWRHLCLDLLFIPVLKRLFEMLDCKLTLHVTPETISRLQEDSDVICWEGSHMFAGILAVVFIALIFPIAMHSTLSSRSSLDTRYLHIPKFYMFDISCQFFIVAASIWPSEMYIPAATVLLIVLAICNIKLQPCIGDGRMINHARSVVLTCSAYVGICNSYLLFIDEATQYASALALIIGLLTVAVIALWLSILQMRYLDFYHLDMIDELDISPAFDWNKISNEEVRKYSDVTDTLVCMSLLTEYQLDVCEDHLDTCVSLLSGPLDSVVPYIAINVVVAVANLASNPSCRGLMAKKGIVPYLLRLLHTSMTVRVQCVALCAVENLTCDERPMVIGQLLNSKLIVRLLPLIDSKDINVQLRALTSLNHIVQSEHESIPQSMFTSVVLFRIFNRLVNNPPLIRAKVLSLLALLSTRKDAELYRNVYLSSIDPEHVRLLYTLCDSNIQDINIPANMTLKALEDIEVIEKSETRHSLRHASATVRGGGINNDENSAPLLFDVDSSEQFGQHKEFNSIERSQQRRQRREQKKARAEEREKLQSEILTQTEPQDWVGGLRAQPLDPKTAEIQGVMSDSDDMLSQKVLYKKKNANLRREVNRLKDELSESWDILQGKDNRLKILEERISQMEKMLEREAKLKRLVDESKNKFQELTPVLGFQLADVSSITKLIRNGCRVGAVRPNRPAAKAGMKENDIITHIGTSLSSTDEFKQVASKYKPGDVIPLQILRNKVQTVHIDLLVEAQEMDVEAVVNLRRIAGENVTLDDIMPKAKSSPAPSSSSKHNSPKKTNEQKKKKSDLNDKPNAAIYSPDNMPVSEPEQSNIVPEINPFQQASADLNLIPNREESE